MYFSQFICLRKSILNSKAANSPYTGFKRIFTFVLLLFAPFSYCNATTIQIAMRSIGIIPKDFNLFKKFIEDEFKLISSLSVTACESDSAMYESVPDFKNAGTEFILVVCLQSSSSLFYVKNLLYHESAGLVYSNKINGVESAPSMASRLPGLLHEMRPWIFKQYGIETLNKSDRMDTENTEMVKQKGDARLFIASIPPVANVYLDGKFVGKTNVSELTLPSGLVTLEFVKGGKSVTKKINLHPGENPSQMLRIP